MMGELGTDNSDTKKTPLSFLYYISIILRRSIVCSLTKSDAVCLKNLLHKNYTHHFKTNQKAK